MTFAIRTFLLTSFSLLVCTSIVFAQDAIPTVVKSRSVPLNELESAATSTKVMAAEKNVDQSKKVKKQSAATIEQARPGERVFNPAHLILNLDTTLGGVPVNGSGPNDFGYLGPGDMRTHLWNSHSTELIANGITEFKLMAMTVPEVQKWHNYFHGAEGSPENSHKDGEQDHFDTIVEHPTTTSSTTNIDDPVYGTIVYENSVLDSGYLYSVDGQPEIIYEQGIIVEEYTP